MTRSLGPGARLLQGKQLLGAERFVVNLRGGLNQVLQVGSVIPNHESNDGQRTQIRSSNLKARNPVSTSPRTYLVKKLRK